MANFNPNALKITNGQFDQTKYNKLVDQLLRQKLRPGPNYSLMNGSGGVVIIPSPAATTTKVYPFDLQVSLDTVAEQITAKIIPGTVNSLVPSNTFASIVETYDPDSPITYYATVECTSDGQSINSVTWQLSTSPPGVQTPVAWSAPAAFSYLFGVIVGSTPYRTIAENSLTFTPTLVIQVPKAGITPNIIPYDNYYSWQPSNGTG